MSEQNFSPLSLGIIEGDVGTTLEELNKLIDDGATPQTVMDQHLIPGMEEVGRRFETNEYFVPELLIAARAMQEAMKVLDPLLKTSGVEKIGRVVIGTVQGDFHDIGKNLVASMLEGGGFEVIDLGVNVSPQKFIEVAREKNGTIVCLSALLTTTMPQMKSVIEELEKEGLRQNFKVMVGGAPVTDDFARQIGADGYSDNASAAVTLAKSFFI